MKSIPAVVALVALASLSEAALAYPVAGLEPDHRPAGAPVVTTAPAPGPGTLHGVIPPVPESVSKFLHDQGNWYTPFTRPGMPVPYDIRGWHSSPAAPTKP
jgi:hypothetical protein